MPDFSRTDHQATSALLQRVLLDSQRWRLISSLIPAEVEPVVDGCHAQWMSRHTHYHTYREVLIALSGTCVYGFRNQVYPCEPGVIFLLDANEPHDLEYSPSADNLLHVWIRMLGDHTIVNIIEVHQGKYRQMAGSPLLQGFNDAGCFFSTIWRECRGNPQWTDALIRLKLMSALGSVVADIVKTDLPAKPKRRTRAVQEQVIVGICHHIAATAGCGISLDLLAQTAGYNKFHLLRLFQAKVGCTIHQYIDRCRAKVVNELLNKGYTKRVISEKLGFSSPTAFSRWLKNHPPSHHVYAESEKIEIALEAWSDEIA